MKYRRFLFIMFTAFFLAILAACSSDPSSEESQSEETVKSDDNTTITLKVASYFADNSTAYRYSVKPWMDQVIEKTNGQVKFEYYPSEQLGKAADLLRLTGDKVADISMLPTIYFPSEMPLTAALTNMPGLSVSANQGSMGYFGLLQRSSDLLEIDYLKNGVRPLLAQNSPPYQIWTKNKEIRVPGDLKGMKIKTAGGISSEFFKSIGSVPVAVAFPELYEAVDRDVIDAISLDATPLDTSGVAEVINHGVITNYGTSLVALVINEQVWQSLPGNVKTIMAQAGEDITGQVGKSSDKETNAFLEEFKKNKNVPNLSEEELNQWKNLGEEFQELWIKEHETEDLKYGELLDMYKESLAKYK